MANYFKNVNGKDIELTDEEMAVRVEHEKEWAKGADKRTAMAKLLSLEGEITPRRIRDSVLTADGKTWLENKEKEIGVERAKL